MEKARLIIIEVGQNPREIEINGAITTIGRAADNVISLRHDANVSRYHAQIERRGENYYLSDLQSRNGTALNGEFLAGETKLQDNDCIDFGGKSQIEFQNPLQNPAPPNQAKANLKSESAEASAPILEHNSQTSESAGQAAPSKIPLLLTVAAVLSGLAIVAVVVIAVVVYRNTGCQAEVTIIEPESGATIAAATEINVNVKNKQCIDHLTYFIDGEQIGVAQTEPFSITLDPAKLTQLIDDNSHVLTIAAIDRNGAKQIQRDQVLLAFEEPRRNKAQKSENVSPADEISTPDGGATAEPNAASVSLSDIKTMSERLVKQIGGSANYKFDPQFLTQVRARTSQFQSDNFSNRAANYRDQINLSFVGEQGLAAPLGYVLAMSRSKFDLKKDLARSNEEGLWRMSADFAASNGYNGQCGAETLGDAKQNCASRVAAVYTKALVVNLFQNDFLYGVACFGLSPAEAGQFQLGLPPERSNFWSAIKAPRQRETIVNFFAAGIVADNPQKFGLKRDRPISNLYPK